jgi:hypothetical protein
MLLELGEAEVKRMLAAGVVHVLRAKVDEAVQALRRSGMLDTPGRREAEQAEANDDGDSSGMLGDRLYFAVTPMLAALGLNEAWGAKVWAGTQSV